MNDGTSKYIATAGADKVITAKPAFLERIIVGKSVGSSIVEVSNHATDGDGDVRVYLEGDTLIGTYDIGCFFSKGICADLTNQTNVTFIFSNRGIG